jgi:hemerythrin-like domain-containing protein
MPKSISKLIMKEHKKINEILSSIEKNLDDFEKTKINFSKFKWNIEKHFFIEEKAILSLLRTTSGAQTNNTFNLLNDHSKIMSLIKKTEAGLNKKIKPDIVLIKEEIFFHEKFEEELFYPRLDEELSINQKKEIIDRLNDILPG